MPDNDVAFWNDPAFVNQEFHALKVTPLEFDLLLEQGWRHFGSRFFRYSWGIHRNELRRVIPLRIRLADFVFSKSQLRILRRNGDLRQVIRPIQISDEKVALFERHKNRFTQGIPDSIYDFLSVSPSTVPGEGLEVCVYQKNTLLAASFFDVGETAVSSVYAMFETLHAKRSLGILTMLLEIEFARKNNKNYYYQGYCYEGDSFYDYKKRFSALERFDWNGNWEDF